MTSAEADGLSRTSRFHPHSEPETPAPRAREPRSTSPRRAASAYGSAAWCSRQTHKRAPHEAVSFSSDGPALLGARRAGACPLKPSRGLVPSFLLLRHPPRVAVDHAASSGRCPPYSLRKGPEERGAGWMRRHRRWLFIGWAWSWPHLAAREAGQRHPYWMAVRPAETQGRGLA